MACAVLWMTGRHHQKLACSTCADSHLRLLCRACGALVGAEVDDRPVARLDDSMQLRLVGEGTVGQVQVDLVAVLDLVDVQKRRAVRGAMSGNRDGDTPAWQRTARHACASCSIANAVLGQ